MRDGEVERWKSCFLWPLYYITVTHLCLRICRGASFLITDDVLWCFTILPLILIKKSSLLSIIEKRDCDLLSLLPPICLSPATRRQSKKSMLLVFYRSLDFVWFKHNRENTRHRETRTSWSNMSVNQNKCPLDSHERWSCAAFQANHEGLWCWSPSASKQPENLVFRSTLDLESDMKHSTGLNLNCCLAVCLCAPLSHHLSQRLSKLFVT